MLNIYQNYVKKSSGYEDTYNKFDHYKGKAGQSTRYDEQRGYGKDDFNKNKFQPFDKRQQNQNNKGNSNNQNYNNKQNNNDRYDNKQNNNDRYDNKQNNNDRYENKQNNNDRNEHKQNNNDRNEHKQNNNDRNDNNGNKNNQDKNNNQQGKKSYNNPLDEYERKDDRNTNNKHPNNKVNIVQKKNTRLSKKSEPIEFVPKSGAKAPVEIQHRNKFDFDSNFQMLNNMIPKDNNQQ